MSLFFTSSTKSKGRVKRSMSDGTLASLGCKACALKDSHRTEPYGAEKPTYYFIAGSPSESDARRGEVLSGAGGRLLKSSIGRAEYNRSRFNAIARCSTSNVKSVDKKKPAISCKDSVVADIEATKPEVIVLLGYEALGWLYPGEHYVDGWHGRMFPIKIGSHECWGMITYDPSFLITMRRKGRFSKELEPSKMELSFANDFKIAKKHVRLGNEAKPVTSGYTDNIDIITGKSDSDVKLLRKALKRLIDDETGVDIETTSLDSYDMTEVIVTCSLSNGDYTVAFSVDHPDSTPFYRKKANKLLKKFLYKSKTKVAHNLKFELEWLGRYYGIDLLYDTDWGDTMSTGYVLDSRQRMLSLDQLIMLEFGFSLKALSKVDVTRILDFAIEDVLLYNGLDSKWTIKLYKSQKERIPRSQKWADWHTLETTMSLADMQMAGMPASTSEIELHRVRLEAAIAKVMKRLNKLECVKEYERKKRKPFSVSSTHDVAYMYEHVLHRLEGKTKKGYSTDADSLELMADEPITPIVLEYRKHTKALSTYVEPMPRVIKYDGKIHCQYHCTRTSTGRLASSDPNFQNWPKRKGKEVRSIITVPPGYCILSADYGQIEARIIGMVAKDKTYIDHMYNNYDIHGDWAKRIATEYPAVLGGKEFLDDPKKLKAFRNDIKLGWTFPLVYGAGYRTCAATLGVPQEIVKEQMEVFWSEFAGIKQWQKDTAEAYEKNFYVETLTGKRRTGPLSYNEILNTPIQGTASELVTFGMNNIRRGLRLPTSAQIHDDLTFIVRIDEADEYVHKIVSYMVNLDLPWLNVPLAVEMEVGTSWNIMSPIGDYTTNQKWVAPPLKVADVLAAQNKG